VTLLAEIFGVLFGGAAIASLLQVSGSSMFGRAAGVAVLVAAFASLLFFENVWGLSSSFPASTKLNEAITKKAAEVAGGAGTNTAFLAWAQGKIVGGHAAPTFWLTPATARTDALTYQWSTYELLPGRETDLMQEANWIVFYGVNPATVYYDHSAFGRLIVYAPGLAVAQRTNVG
jgi:hypothetical protein